MICKVQLISEISDEQNSTTLAQIKGRELESRSSILSKIQSSTHPRSKQRLAPPKETVLGKDPFRNALVDS